MHPHSGLTATRLALQRYARRLVNGDETGSVSATHGDLELHEQLDIVLGEIARRMLDGAGVIPAPGRVPHSRAAYSIGFITLLVSTAQQLAADPQITPMPGNLLHGRVTRRAFAAFDDDEYALMAGKGILAIDRMLDVVQQAGRLEEWLTSLSDALETVISSRGERGNEQLVEHFVTLPMAVRTLQSTHAG